MIKVQIKQEISKHTITVEDSPIQVFRVTTVFPDGRKLSSTAPSAFVAWVSTFDMIKDELQN